MPSNLLMSDVSFPKFEEGQSNDEKFRLILNYLHMLQEQLRYTLANVGVNNFNETEIKSLGEIINQPVFLRLEDETGKIINLDATVNGLIIDVENEAEARESSITQLADSIMLEVQSDNGKPASITLSVNGEGKGKVDLRGLVSFTDLEDPESNTTIDGGNIRTGTITGITINGCFFRCVNDSSDPASGEISFHDADAGGVPKVGSIKFVSTDSTNCEVVITTDDTGAARNYNIALRSGGSIILDANDGIYIGEESLNDYIADRAGGSSVAVFG